MLAAQSFVGPAIDWYRLSNILVILGGALVMLLVGSLTPKWPRGMYALGAAVTTGASAVLTALLWRDLGEGQSISLVGNALTLDHFGLLSTFVMTVSVLLVSLVVNDHLEREGEDGPEVYGLMLSALIGGIIMVLANDLLVLFLGLETLSLAFYLLVASSRKRSTSGEAGLKYFILGGFASAFFLYGIALIFGVAGSTNLPKVAEGLARLNVGSSDSMILAGVALLLVGFAFKVSLVPFHVWTPDVYQGAPTPITALMASVGKVAAFSALARVFLTGLSGRADDWAPAIYALAVVTLVVGSAVAIVQTDVKRMLAYSSISHAGFILVGLEAAIHTSSPDAALGVSSISSYLLIYSLLVIGTFAVASVVVGEGDATLDSFKGLGKSNPVLALALTVLLLAQAGVPITSGFIAKFGVIRAAVAVESYPLAIIAMVAAVVAAYLYLRIMVSMWLVDSAGNETRNTSLSSNVAIALTVVAALVLGTFPGLVLGPLGTVAL
jgi:NADH-quinone oxidoreductase subunit N